MTHIFNANVVDVRTFGHVIDIMVNSTHCLGLLIRRTFQKCERGQVGTSKTIIKTISILRSFFKGNIYERMNKLIIQVSISFYFKSPTTALPHLQTIFSQPPPISVPVVTTLFWGPERKST